jgi:hypothetical protein
MPRGRASEVGDKTVNQNGYEQTKTEDGWVGTHILVMEESLGRRLGKHERVRFKDGDRTNFKLDNLELYVLKQGSLHRRLAVVEANIRELEAERDNILMTIKRSAEEASKS